MPGSLLLLLVSCQAAALLTSVVGLESPSRKVLDDPDRLKTLILALLQNRESPKKLWSQRNDAGNKMNFFEMLQYQKEMENEVMNLLNKPQILQRDWLAMTGQKPDRLYDAMYQFSFHDCGSGSTAARMKSFTVSPDPLNIPGTANIAFDLDLNSDVDSPVHAYVKIQKKVWFFWVTVPCTNNVGTCSYSDLCALIPVPCPWSSGDFPCQCPILSGEYTLPYQSFQIPAQSIPIPSWLKNGDYYIQASGTQNGNQVFCFDINISLYFN